MLSDKYFCNFSLFQSLPMLGLLIRFPDHAIHRLNEEPVRTATVQDMTSIQMER